LRTSKKVSGTSEAFTWDVGEGLPLLISDGATSYVTGPNGLPLEQVSGTTVSFYDFDQLGSVRAITNSRGATVNTYSYGAYGNVSSHSGTLVNPFQYSGQYQDSESAFYYLRARYYDPNTEQFVTRDPVSMRTRAPYVYVLDTPLNGRDPSGLDGCQCVAYDFTHIDVGNLLKDAAQEAFKQLLDQWAEGGVKAIARLAKVAGRFIEGVNYLVAIANADAEYADVQDSGLRTDGMAISIMLQTAGAGAFTAIGALAGGLLLAETGPGAAVGAIVGAFSGAIIGGILAYFMDVITHCMFKQLAEEQHRHT
jgi:RHS repeat-associated protein